ncbi:MAG: BACON domain-containing protein [Bacteroidales bacterium]|nr:BACON domain-containing protein [Bacteroidales bacterium]
MKKILLYILILSAAVSCREKAEYNRTLGLLSEYNVLSADGGSTQVAVYSNTDRTVEFDHQVSWASIDRFKGVKSGYLVFDYEVNYGRARRVNLIFKAGEETLTLSMYQNARFADADCIMDLNATTIEVPSSGSTEEIAFETNLIYNLDEMFLSLTYPEGQETDNPWISLKSVEKDKVSIVVAPNTSGAPRTANMRLTHIDAGSYDSTEGDIIYSNTVTIAQNQ